MQRRLLLGLCGVALTTVAAGCGGGNDVQTPAGTAASVAARQTSLGTVLVDGRGRTLYLFEKDSDATSRCSGSCASAWPPLASASKPSAAGEGVDAAKLGTTPGASPVVTYAGHPLYTYAGDAKPGDVHGQGLDQFGAEWYALTPDGRPVDDDDDE